MYALFLEEQKDPALEREYPDHSVRRFRLLTDDKATSGPIVLTEFVCETRELFDWFCTHAEALVGEQAPDLLPEGPSLAQRIAKFYEQVDVDDDPTSNAIIDAVYAYRRRHGLRFALRGVDVEDIYLGQHNCGHEISCAGEPAWSYPVDLRQFLAELPSP